MSSEFRTLVLTLCLSCFALPQVLAAEEALTLQPEKTKLSLHLPATGHDVEGSLTLKSGMVTFDRATGAAGGLIEIDVLKTATGNGSRDEKMHEEVLQSAKFPVFVFKPQKLVGALAAQGASQVDLVGLLTLLGKEHELKLPVKVVIEGDLVKATSSFKIPFVAWGLKDPSIFILKVAKEVEIKIELEGKLNSGGAA